jgi:hypothetical protein
MAIGSRLDRYAPNTLAFMASLVLHVLLLLCLALWIARSLGSGGVLVIEATNGLPGATELALLGSADLELPTLELEPSASSPSELTGIDVATSLAAEQSGNPAAGHALLAAATLASLPSSGVAEDLLKGGSEFFGAYAEGQRFVFVLDSSRSMTGHRWLYACQELLDSVSKLKPEQQFSVICFDVGPRCMFNTPLSRAKFYHNDPATQTRLRRWLAGLQLGPATQPATAILKALALHPDAIFLLSDGEIQDDTITKLRAVNGFSSERPQVPIHAIHLMSQEGKATLQLIARENAGTFVQIQGGQ